MSVWWNERRLQRLAAGELSAERTTKLWAHLQTCEACRTRYDTLAGAQRLLASGGESAALAQHFAPFSARVLSGTRSARKPRSPWLLLQPALALAVVAVLVFTVRRVPQEFAARAGTEAPFSVRAFCVAPDGRFSEACAPGVPLQIAYLASKPTVVQVIGDGGVDLTPFPQHLSATHTLQPLPVNATKQRLLFVFSDTGVKADFSALARASVPQLPRATIIVLP